MALVVDPPLADEINGLRRALGDPSLARIPPHVTLVPPVNIRRTELSSALRRMRSAAAAQAGPLRLTFGSVSSFLPANPVLYLSVGGDLEALRRLRDAVFAEPFERPLSWPWVPHLTLADGVEPERVGAGLQSLSSYAVVADLDRVVVLEEGRGRIWSPLADAVLGRPARVGTGGLAVEITAGRLLDPEIAEAIETDRSEAGGADGGAADGRGPVQPSLVLTAHREEEPVATGVAWLDRVGPHVAVWVRPEHRGQGLGALVLSQLEAAVRRAGWSYLRLDAEGPAGFYRAVSRWSRPAYSKATEE